MLTARPGLEIPKNELLDIFYAGLTNESRSYLDSCPSCVSRERTPKKRGMLVLSPKDMQEAKKSIKEKGIKAKDVKNLPPIEKLCEPTTHPPMVEV